MMVSISVSQAKTTWLQQKKFFFLPHDSYVGEFLLKIYHFLRFASGPLLPVTASTPTSSWSTSINSLTAANFAVGGSSGSRSSSTMSGDCAQCDNKSNVPWGSICFGCNFGCRKHTWTEIRLNPSWVYLESKGSARTPSIRTWERALPDMSVG